MEHALGPFFPELARFDSTDALTRSPLFRRLRPEIERTLATVVHEPLGNGGGGGATALRAVAWNIERGLKLDGVVRALAEHPVLSGADLYLLSELDHGMARSANRFVAREIASRLGLHYAFAPCYLNLSKGAGFEARAAGDNTLGLAGNAIFSRHPLSDPHSLALPPGKDLMLGREKRIGCERAVIATVAHPGGDMRAVVVHLDAHSTRRHRARQMALVLDHVDHLQPRLPVLLGGDFNTTTYNSQTSLHSILGYFRRLLMGVGNVVRNHYPHPDRYFERALFAEIERRGFRYRDLNAPGACTWHYHVDDHATNDNLGEWLPAWCFWFIRQALKLNGGSCSFKLDWFAARDFRPAATLAPQVLGDLHPAEGPLSDHEPIVVEVERT